MSIALAAAAATAMAMAGGAAYLRRRRAGRDWSPEHAPEPGSGPAPEPGSGPLPAWEIAVWQYDPRERRWTLRDAATSPTYPLAALDRFALAFPMHDPARPERGGYRITIQPPGGSVRVANRHERRRAHAIARRVR